MFHTDCTDAEAGCSPLFKDALQVCCLSESKLRMINKTVNTAFLSPYLLKKHMYTEKKAIALLPCQDDSPIQGIIPQHQVSTLKVSVSSTVKQCYVHIIWQLADFESLK